MYIAWMPFVIYFFISGLSNVLSVNTESLVKLPSDFSSFSVVRYVRNKAFWIGEFWVRLHPNVLPDFFMRMSRKESLFSLSYIESWMSLNTELSIANRESNILRPVDKSISQSRIKLFQFFTKYAWCWVCNSIQ